MSFPIDQTPRPLIPLSEKFHDGLQECSRKLSEENPATSRREAEAYVKHAKKGNIRSLFLNISKFDQDQKISATKAFKEIYKKNKKEFKRNIGLIADPEIRNCAERMLSYKTSFIDRIKEFMGISGHNKEVLRLNSLRVENRPLYNVEMAVRSIEKAMDRFSNMDPRDVPGFIPEKTFIVGLAKEELSELDQSFAHNSNSIDQVADVILESKPVTNYYSTETIEKCNLKGGKNTGERIKSVSARLGIG